MTAVELRPRSRAAGRAAPDRVRRRVPAFGVVHVTGLLVFVQWYSLVRSWVTGTPERAWANASAVIGLERRLGLFSERSIHDVLVAHPAWCRWVNIYYGAVHFVAPIIVLTLLYRRRRIEYRTAVVGLVAMNVVAIVVFWAWPLMPPRLLPPEYGFVDVGAVFPGLPLDQAVANGPGNGFAAMPSLHMGYAVWAAVAGRRLVSPTFRPLVVAYPALTALVVVATANHYWLDVVAGAGFALAAAHAATSRPAARLVRSLESLVRPGTVAFAAAMTALMWSFAGQTIYVIEDLGLVMLIAGRAPHRMAGTGTTTDERRRVERPYS